MADNNNPFDTPLQSEVQDHQQAQAATVQASDNGNPFEHPLLSEKAEAPQGQDTWTNFDPNQPLTSYGAATRAGVGGLVSDTLGAVKGAVSFLNPKPQSQEETHAFGVAGVGGVYAHRMLESMSPVARAAMHPSEIAQAIHEINNSPDPKGTYLKIAQKTASQGAAQAATAIATEGAVRGVGKVAGSVGDVTKSVSDIRHGESVAQEPAKSTMRQAAKTSATDAGVEAGDTEGSMRSALDDSIKNTATKERGLYDKLNKASGTDLKSLYDHASDVQDALDDPTNVSQRTALQKEMQTTQDAITKGEAQATANGVDPKSLTSAKAATQQRFAMEAVKQKLFNNESVVSGNVQHGVPETINVKNAIRQVESLDKPSRYAPEGTPSRLQQAFGEQGAKALKQGLYDSQKAGQSALSKQQLLKKITAVAGVGGGAIVGLHELSSLLASSKSNK